MALSKSSFLLLKPGSEILLNNTGRGYTKGGDIKIDRMFGEMNNQKYGIVGTKLLDVTATINVNFLQYDSNTYDIIFETNYAEEPDYFTLKVTYLTRVTGVDKVIEFKKVYVADTGSIPIGGRQDIPFPVTFKAIQNSDRLVYTYPT